MQKRFGKTGLVLVLLSGSLLGCTGPDRALSMPPVPDDYHARHPVSLRNEEQHLDVFQSGITGKLDIRQARDVQDFARQYKAKGQGPLIATLPATGPMIWANAQSNLEATKRILTQSGIPLHALRVETYQVPDARQVAPLRLTFWALQTHVHRCGEWPEDLGNSTNGRGFENKSYWNLGCASQTTLAAQVGDPRDLVRPRSEDPGDVAMRTRAIENIRAGKDPGTDWGSFRSNISQVGTQQ